MKNESVKGFDALLPPEMAEKAETAGVAKANMGFAQLFVLAGLAGAFIALGAVFSTTVVTGASGEIPYGIAKLLGGAAFSVGLMFVVIGGAELFTGNNLIVMAWAGGKVTLAKLVRNWFIVYIGNFAGAVLIAVLVVYSGQPFFADGAVGRTILDIAEAKTSLGFLEAVILGTLCNVLVCLAVWMSFSARTTTDRILAVFPPIAAFVASGFEHSVANMYFIPAGLLVKLGIQSGHWELSGVLVEGYADLTLAGFVQNLIPVTIGNIIGGALLVGVVYWFVYLWKPGIKS